MRRGGLDYHELTETARWPSWDACRAELGSGRRWFATTAGSREQRYDAIAFETDDVVVFGCEPDGLPADVLGDFTEAQSLYIPMRPHNRSMNLASAVAVVVYEAWRQHDFAGASFGTTEEARPPLP